MRGLERIRDIRRRGMRPDVVTFWAFGTCQRQALEGTVLCDELDSPCDVDLRPFKGLTVHVVAPTGPRFEAGEAWARELMKAEASTVCLLLETTPAEGYVSAPVTLRRNNEDLA